MAGELTEPVWAVNNRKSGSLCIAKHEIAVYSTNTVIVFISSVESSTTSS